MYLFLDLIWLLNFGIDYLLLWLTALFRGTPCSKWRLALAAMVGASFVLILFVPPLTPYYTFLTKWLLSTVIVYIAFGYGSLQAYIKSYFTFCFVSFMIGGGLLAIHFLLETQHQLVHGVVATHSSGYGDPISWVFVVIGFPLVYWFSHRQWKSIKTVKMQKESLVQVEVYFGQERISCRGLVDTGNRLAHPISKRPVCIVEAACLTPIVPEALLTSLDNVGDWEKWGGMEELEDQWLARLSMMPYRGVGHQGGLLLTLRPDKVVITMETRCYQCDRVLLGISQHPIANEGLFQAIVHPDLLSGCNQIEDAHYEEAIQC